LLNREREIERERDRRRVGKERKVEVAFVL